MIKEPIASASKGAIKKTPGEVPSPKLILANPGWRLGALVETTFAILQSRAI